MVKIFIFDDHDSVRESYKRWLEIEGYKVVGAEGTTKNCIRQIKSAKPDVIMMDIDFPEKERAGILAAQKITKEIKNARIIFVSHYNEQEIIVETLKSGASGYFAKSDELKYLKETTSTTPIPFLNFSTTEGLSSNPFLFRPGPGNVLHRGYTPPP